MGKHLGSQAGARTTPATAQVRDLYDKIDGSRFPNLKQMLRGLRNYHVLSFNRQRPYNYYNRLLMVPLAYVGVKLLHHYMFKTEYDQRKRPNPLMPRFIYKVRRQHYVYWEIARLARGLPKTFTYSTWDPKAHMMYHVDMQGEMSFEKLNLREERLDLLQNPLLGPLFRRKSQMHEEDRMARRANKIAIYYLNLGKKWDLDSYLQQRWLTPMDFIRAVWYYGTIWTGYADQYRNEQFVPKTDFWYEHEAKMHAINFRQPDSGQVATNLMIALSCELEQLNEWLTSVEENDDEDENDEKD